VSSPSGNIREHQGVSGNIWKYQGTSAVTGYLLVEHSSRGQKLVDSVAEGCVVLRT